MKHSLLEISLLTVLALLVGCASTPSQSPGPVGSSPTIDLLKGVVEYTPSPVDSVMKLSNQGATLEDTRLPMAGGEFRFVEGEEPSNYKYQLYISARESEATTFGPDLWNSEKYYSISSHAVTIASKNLQAENGFATNKVVRLRITTHSKQYDYLFRVEKALVGAVEYTPSSFESTVSLSLKGKDLGNNLPMGGGGTLRFVEGDDSSKYSYQLYISAKENDESSWGGNLWGDPKAPLKYYSAPAAIISSKNLEGEPDFGDNKIIRFRITYHGDAYEYRFKVHKNYELLWWPSNTFLKFPVLYTVNGPLSKLNVHNLVDIQNVSGALGFRIWQWDFFNTEPINYLSIDALLSYAANPDSSPTTYNVLLGVGADISGIVQIGLVWNPSKGLVWSFLPNVLVVGIRPEYLAQLFLRPASPSK